MNKSKKIKNIIYIFLIILIIASSLYIIKYYYDVYSKKQESKLLNNISIDKNLVAEENISIGDEEGTNNDLNISGTTERMLKLEELQKQNPDIIGWLEIENTDINYPVLQGKDNSYYMTHNYKKEYSSNGSVFLDKDFSWDKPSDNLLIYGHNMNNNTMFEDLLSYQNESFYKDHPNIRFTTSDEDAIYEIISAFKSRVYYKSEQNVFRYYYFVNSQNEDDYNNFVKNAKKASIYDTGKTANYGDQLMTLSTCSYYTEDGRFAVVAKKS